MIRWIILVMILGLGSPILAQEYYLNSFMNPNDVELIGYVNNKGDTILPAVYNPVLSNAIIYNVGAINSLEKDIGAFYINREGKKFGRDSLWAFDFSYDTESEGFIRYSIGNYEQQTKRAGLFDWKGNVRIPALYNHLSAVRHGLLTGYIGGEYYPHGDYWFTRGGHRVLIDTNGTVLVNDSLEMKKLDRNINFYSMKRGPTPIADRINVKTVAGDYLSFDHYHTELKHFIHRIADFDDVLLDTILVKDRRTAEKRRRSGEKQDDRVGRKDFLEKEDYAVFRSEISSIMSQIDEIKDFRHYQRLPHAYEIKDKMINSKVENVWNTYTYDFLKPFEEMVPSDERYMKIPILKAALDPNATTLLFARESDGNYKLIEVTIKKKQQ